MKTPYNDYRIVFLRDKSGGRNELDPPHKDFTYYVPLDKLKNIDNPLTNLIASLKKENEWKKLLDEAEKNYLHLGKERYIQALRKATPEIFLEGFDSLVKAMPECTNVFKILAWEAKKIVARQTIFIFPTVNENEIDTYQDIMEAITEDVDRHLDKTADTLGEDMPFSFAIESKELNGGETILLDQMVDILLQNINRGVFDVLKHHLYKEGPVLLEGPTGVGKTMFSKLFAKEYLKRRTQKFSSKEKKNNQKDNFHHVNVSSIPEDLIESRIRGTVKGYATNVREMPGWFEMANNGVLFFDEFQNAPIWVQTQLLDIMDPLSNKANISRLGSPDRKVFNVKVLLAVNESVQFLIKERKLRNDLYHRIRQVLRLPSFNELLEDIDKMRGGVKQGRLSKETDIHIQMEASRQN